MDTEKTQRRGILHSYFYWTYPRGSFHYDVMVTLILLFIFVAPHFWNFGERPVSVAGPTYPIQVVNDGGRNMLLTFHTADAKIPMTLSERDVKKALRSAIEPVAGDAVAVEGWETYTDAEGNLNWKVSAHR